jgi:hypothetical protein
MKKLEYILQRCKGKNVLDLGCVQDPSKLYSKHWLHEKIYNVATSVVGVDLEDVQLSPKYLYIRENVEDLHKNKNLCEINFDVIVAGDIIEHLFNPGLFLDSVKKLKFDTLVIATPNVMSPKYWTLGKEKCRDDHTCWYSMKTLTQFLEMKGYTIIDKSYGFDQKINGIRPLIKYLTYKLLPQTGNRLLITATT